MSRRVLIVSLGLAAIHVAVPAPLWAQDPVDSDEAVNVMANVDADLGKARDDLAFVALGYGGPTPKTERGRLERRLREGEIHFLLNDYLRAAIVLFDVVDKPENQSHPRYDDAVFHLAESLRQLENYSESRAYFEQLLDRARGERLKQVVLSLLEIANQTRRYDKVEEYVDRLRQSGGLAQPEVDYIHGKTLYQSAEGDPQKLQASYQAFKAVPADHKLAPSAAYYAGVTQVQLGRYAESVPEFETAARLAGKKGEGKPVYELAQLSLGRVHFELGNIEKAVDAYQEIGRSSPHFSDMLFEVAWAHVKAAKQAEDDATRQTAMTRALRMAEILMASAPDSQLFPEARILEGNLQIKLGAPESAYDTFQSIVDAYGGARTELANLIASNPDPRQFFDQLVQSDMHNVGAKELLPPIAITWANKAPEMRQAVNVLSDLQTSDQHAKDSRELVDTLSLAIRGEQRYNLFKGIAEARTKAVGVENRLLLVDRRLLNLERRMLLPYLDSADQARLDAAYARRSTLEAEIAALPQSAEQAEQTRTGISEAYREVEHRAFRQAYQVSSMRAQLAAIDVWLGNNRSQLTAEQADLISNRLTEAREQVAEIERELEDLQSRIRTVSAVSGGDAGRARAETLRAEYREVLVEEADILRSMRSRLPASLASIPARMDGQRAAADQMRTELQRLQRGLDEQIESKVAEVREQIDTEQRRLGEYEQEYAVLRTETDTMLGPVATETLHTVADEFKQLVLRADVGIIDVAWARKQGITDKVGELVQEQQEKTRELELEFSDVLEGN